MRSNLPVTEREYILEDGKTIVSTTDLKGNIVYANPYFIEVSGFSENELIGAAQNIVRHPDMPADAFADLWRTVQSGMPWTGMVKNRCRNGDFYWVLANVTQVIENGAPTGYMSVRTKPPREQVLQAAQLYRDIMAGNPDRIAIEHGLAVDTGWRRTLAALKDLSLARRIAINLGVIIVLAAGVGVKALLLDADNGLALAGAAIVVAALYFWHALHAAIVRPLREATHAARILAGGDLTAPIAATGHDDVGQLVRLIRQLNINLASVIGDIRGNFVQIRRSTQEVRAGNMDLSARTESQASNLEQTSASMEELSSTVQQNAENAVAANGLANGATAIAEKTGAAVAEVVAAMNGIDTSSKKIAEITGLIDGIAFQTNILALNAAVEAARAGEHGRGFAVVASEVRSLAQKSAAAAKEIRQLIDISTEKIRAGTTIADQAGHNMSEVIEAIKQVASIMTDISLATREQSAGISQVKDAILQMDEVTQQNAAMVEAAAASSATLDEQVRAVANALQVFKLGRFAASDAPLSIPTAIASGHFTDRPAIRAASGRTAVLSERRACASASALQWH